MTMNTKTLKLSADLFEHFLKEPSGPGITQAGMPSDAVIQLIRFDRSTRVILLTIASAEFDDAGGDFVIWWQKSAQAASMAANDAEEETRG
jgi:hypothetical protein